ncbi:MAG: hypothetical protein HQL20_07095 [Candidatus Omnitrophica bacterium]|nr:hypothetical protein [Candidatus Omnitrophota bacterium]
METIEDKIYRRVRGKGCLWAFSDSDFWDIASRESVRQSLVRLLKEGKIRRLFRGLYDYPKFSEFLNEQVSPDLSQVAQALARKFGWRIRPSGDAALSYLGLSTQVAGKVLYFSDGPDREYFIGKQPLIFQKTLLKHASLKYPESSLVVEALDALTQDRFTPQIARKIRSRFNEAVLKRILLDARCVKGWIHDCIRVICLGVRSE